MVNEYIQKVQRAYEQSQIFPIVTEIDLRSFHNITKKREAKKVCIEKNIYYIYT
jgi:hypothetical protein